MFGSFDINKNLKNCNTHTLVFQTSNLEKDNKNHSNVNTKCREACA